MKTYQIKEIFHSIQGEGVRAGTPAVFVRFSGCNLRCNTAEHGFDCDTDFIGGKRYHLGALLDAVRAHAMGGWVILTGGEPALQLDQTLIDVFHAAGYRLAIETNGTRELPKGLDWVCASPKPNERLTPFLKPDEVKYVLSAGMEPDELKAPHLLVSPAFKGDEPDPDAIAWCVDWVLNNPEWRLSVQLHKYLGVR